MVSSPVKQQPIIKYDEVTEPLEIIGRSNSTDTRRNPLDMLNELKETI